MHRKMSKEEKNITELNGTSASVFTSTTATSEFTTTDDADEEYVEIYSTEVKLAFATLACVSGLSSLAAITFMHRSKKIPYAAKFLSTGLLMFDVLFILLSTIRKFITNSIVNLNVQTSVMVFVQLANITVGLMSLERCCLFLKPMQYIKVATEKFIRKTVISIWLCDVCLSLSVRYGVCYIIHSSSSVYITAGVCNNIMSAFYSILVMIILVTSITCYVKIFICIRSKLRSGKSPSVSATTKAFQSYRSTSLVFIYVIVILLTSLAYGAIIILVQNQKLRHTSLRIALEAVSICNCALDPFLYVLWFKECRMQFVMFLAIFLKRYRRKAEQMRIEVYNIVTVSDKM